MGFAFTPTATEGSPPAIDIGRFKQSLSASRVCTTLLTFFAAQLISLHSPAPVQVANEIWVLDKGTVQKWDGDIVSYKQHLRQQHAALAKRDDMK